MSTNIARVMVTDKARTWLSICVERFGNRLGRCGWPCWYIDDDFTGDLWSSIESFFEEENALFGCKSCSVE